MAPLDKHSGFTSRPSGGGDKNSWLRSRARTGERRAEDDRRVRFDRREMIRFDDDRRSGFDRRADLDPWKHLDSASPT